jgi:hypothetical protein
MTDHQKGKKKSEDFARLILVRVVLTADRLLYSLAVWVKAPYRKWQTPLSVFPLPKPSFSFLFCVISHTTQCKQFFKMASAHFQLHIKTQNRPDEWKIEQGLSGAVLPVLDMTGPKTKTVLPQVFGERTIDEEAIKSVGDRSELFKMERKGWKG